MSGAPLDYDKLIEVGDPTVRQEEILQLVKTGGVNGAAKALNVCRKTIQKAIKAVEKKAARQGHAKGVWEIPVAPGYILGKVTTQLNGEGEIVNIWPRQHPEATEIVEQIREMVAGFRDELPACEPVTVPTLVSEDLCVQYTITDFHFGMLAHACEGDHVGAAWDLDIAENVLVGSIAHLANEAPPAEEAVLILLGDFLHFDGPDPVTPSHRHPLDASGRQRTVVRACTRAMRRVIRILLLKHKRVRVMVLEGNHDLSATPWLRENLIDHYELEPRVEVLDCDLPYQALEFGVTLIGAHHGHKKKKEALPLLFAQLFREMFGRTKKMVISTGHYHEKDEKDHAGVTVMQHRTMAAADSHSMRGGWFSEREMQALHFHRHFGLRGRNVVTPEMLEALAPPAEPKPDRLRFTA